MKRVIRDIIRDNAVLYRIFLKIRLGKDLRLPTASTDCHLTGYPRSANTYSHYLAKGLFPELEFVTHVHTVASLKAARRNGVPVMVILRDPKNAVVSMCLKYKRDPADQQSIDGYIYDYIHYHEWILDHLPDARFCTFEEVTQGTSEFALRLAHFLDQELDEATLEGQLESIHQTFQAREKLKDPDGSSLPQESRRARKEAFLLNVEQSSRLPEATSLYESILSKID